MVSYFPYWGCCWRRGEMSSSFVSKSLLVLQPMAGLPLAGLGLACCFSFEFAASLCPGEALESCFIFHCLSSRPGLFSRKLFSPLLLWVFALWAFFLSLSRLQWLNLCQPNLDKREWPTLTVINLQFITLLVVKWGFKSTDHHSNWQWALAGSPERAWVPSSCTGQHG